MNEWMDGLRRIGSVYKNLSNDGILISILGKDITKRRLRAVYMNVVV